MGSLWLVGFGVAWLFTEVLNRCVFGLYYELLLFGLCVQLCIEFLFIEIDGMIATVGPPFSLQN